MHIYIKRHSSMTKKEIVDSICNSKEWPDICRRIANGNDIWNDLFQEFVLIIFQMPEQKLIELNNTGELQWYCVRVIMNMYQSANTPFFKNYRQQYSDLPVMLAPDDYDHWVDDDYKRALEAIETLPYYEREMFKGYLRHGSYRKFSKEIDIVACSIAATVSKARVKLKQALKA